MWLNPPYGKDEQGRSVVAKWIGKVAGEYASGRVAEALILVNANVSMPYSRPLAPFPRCEVCIPPKGRPCFRQPGGGEQDSPTQSAIVCYLGPRVADFHAAFRPIGGVFVPYEMAVAWATAAQEQEA